MNTDVTEFKQGFSLAPQNIEELIKYADLLSKSDLVPKEFIGKPGNIIVAIQWGLELGLQAMQAMQNIAVINGRPSLWGDSVIALVKSSPLCEYVVEEVNDSTASCKVKRRGEPEQVRFFTMDDAQKAGLKGKSGPWTNYPKRMLQMRARSWALRDVFPDVLRGMPITEELMDMPIHERDVTPATKTETPDPVFYSDEEFIANENGWKKVIENGKTPERFIAFIESKGKLFTSSQKEEITLWDKKPDVIEGESKQVNDPFVDEMNAAESENQ